MYFPAEMQQGGERWQARRAVEGFAAHDMVVLTLLLCIQAQQHVQLDAGMTPPSGSRMRRGTHCKTS